MLLNYKPKFKTLTCAVRGERRGVMSVEALAKTEAPKSNPNEWQRYVRTHSTTALWAFAQGERPLANKTFFYTLSFIACLFFISTTFSFNPQIEPLVRTKKITHKKIKVRITPKLKQYLRSCYFVAEYEDPTIDLTKFDDSINLIPFIMTIIPIVWVSNIEFGIEVMDEDLFYALEKIKKVFKRFYPSLSWSGALIPKKLKKNKLKHAANMLGVLFSGGLDAVTSSFAHSDTPQLLITIGGSDVSYYEKNLWEYVKKQTITFAQKYNKQHTCVRSNFAAIGNSKFLKSLSTELTQWWALTSQSLGYTGLTAPLLYHYGIKHLVIGSSHTADLPMPYGTHPLIDNEISFADSTVYHDCGNLDRLEKIDLISKVCKQNDLPQPKLRVCWGNDKTGGNCCLCEKCLRTINELLIMGKKPKKFGFDVDVQTAISTTKKFFSNNRKLKARQLWHWHCVQKHIPFYVSGLDSDVQQHCLWLQHLPLERFAKNTAELQRWQDQDPKLAALWRESIKKKI